MNDRIKELAEQADDYATEKARDGYSNYNLVYDRKFAELIVRECLTVISKASKEASEQNTYMGNDVPSIVHQMLIAKHFGIK